MKTPNPESIGDIYKFMAGRHRKHTSRRDRRENPISNEDFKKVMSRLSRSSGKMIVDKFPTV